MKEERKILTLDNYDHGMVITALNDKRNLMLKEKKSTAIEIGRASCRERV